jgi:radical SAM superfamily enzyme YgiQ (UPF0313 family)
MDDLSRAASVLLNCMPPAQIMMPSISLNILKNVLQQNGIRSEVVYWNLKFEPHFSLWAEHFDEDNFELPRMLPFVYHAAKHYGDERAMERIRNLLTKTITSPDQKKNKGSRRSRLLKLPAKSCDLIEALITSELAKTDFSDVVISGFTAKFLQWLPALVVASETKKMHPHISTVIGGFETRGSAMEMLRNFSCFDYAVWGEGEYPLLELTQAEIHDAADLSQIAGLVYRKDGHIVVAKKKERQYLDFYTPAALIRKKDQILSYPIETSRGCSWNRCKFCVLSQGYRYRERHADSIIEEIGTAVNKYGAGCIQFMDNNIMGSNRKRIGDLLDKLAGFFLGCTNDYYLTAEIIPCGLDAAFYKKLALAGFRMVQLGGESFSDQLIRKMNKMNSFSDNLLAYKFCLKYGILPIGANIITGIPGETIRDIKSCTDNIPFLRFFVGPRSIQFTESPFALEKHSRFNREINENERKKHCEHYLFNYLPEGMTKGMNRFDLFHFIKAKPPARKKLWKKFFNTLDRYFQAGLTYKIYGNGDTVQFEEYCRSIKTDSLVFDRPEQWQILVHANSRLVSFDEMLNLIQSRYTQIDPTALIHMMKELKSKHMLYYDEHYNKIVSVIDTDTLL